MSKLGNNNTYCHDNRLNWINWELLDSQPDFHAFTRFLIHFRHRHPALRRDTFFRGSNDIEWRDTEGNWPDWTSSVLTLAALIRGHRKATLALKDDNDLFLALNFHWQPRTFQIPQASEGRRWVCVINTAHDPGFSDQTNSPSQVGSILLEARTITVLVES
jgi:glycogen operon protein